MLTPALIRAAVRKLSISAGIYTPGTLSRLLDPVRSEKFKQDGTFYTKLLTPDSLCFDVGANMGEMTETLLNVGMRVVAFEPQPDCVKQLKARCNRYREQLDVCQSAVGAAAGRASLYVSKNTVVSSLEKTWSDSDKSIDVAVTTLDAAIAKYGTPIYCKIDAEGWELEVLKGLTRSIPLLSFEYHFKEDRIRHARSCLEYLSCFGKLEVNITPAETLSFEFETWKSLDEFLRLFPSGFEGREEFQYGDIFVRVCRT